MDFKRIEWIFLIVFIGINIFLGIEIFQTPTLLTSTRYGSTTPTDLATEISNDNISVPRVSNQQGEGYYLSATIDSGWIDTAREQIEDANVATSVSDSDLHVTLTRPIKITKSSSKLSQVEKFKNNSKYVYQGKKYKLVKEISSNNEYIFDQLTSYGSIFSNRARLHIRVRNNEIISYTQNYTGKLTPVRERQTTISDRAAIDSLYTSSELPDNSKILWIKKGYTKLIDVRNSRIFIPAWIVAIRNNDTRNVSIKRVNAFNGNVIQDNSFSDENKDEKTN